MARRARAPASARRRSSVWRVGLALMNRQMLPVWQHIRSRCTSVRLGERSLGYESARTRTPDPPPGTDRPSGLGARTARLPLHQTAGECPVRRRVRRAPKNCSDSHGWVAACSHPHDSSALQASPTMSCPVHGLSSPGCRQACGSSSHARACRTDHGHDLWRNAVGGGNPDGVECAVAATRIRLQSTSR